MEFLKSFLLFYFLVFLFSFVVLILWFVAYSFAMFWRAVFKKEFRPIPIFLSKSSFPSWSKTKKVLLMYLVITTSFYLYGFVKYIIPDRPYKQAKSYAISGDFIFWWQVLVVNFQTGNWDVVKALEFLQTRLVLPNIYRLIPEGDAEREIWLYRFYQFYYARSLYAHKIVLQIKHTHLII